MRQLLWLLVGVAEAVTYTLNMQYTCANETNGECLRWTSGGSVSTSTSCFPGDSLVISDKGVVRMDALKIGDLILGHDATTGLDVFTPVRSWLHRFPSVEFDYIKLHTKRGEVEMAKHHNMAVAVKDGSIIYNYADEIPIGSQLWTREGPEAVISKSTSKNVGYYAPLTYLSNFYVGTDASNVYLAHSFAHVRSPDTIAPVLHGVMSACELFDGGLHEMDDHTEYIHPVARKLQAVFPFLLDKPPQKFQLQSNAARQNARNSKAKALLNTIVTSLMSPNPMVFCSRKNCLGLGQVFDSALM